MFDRSAIFAVCLFYCFPLSTVLVRWKHFCFQVCICFLRAGGFSLTDGTGMGLCLWIAQARILFCLFRASRWTIFSTSTLTLHSLSDTSHYGVLSELGKGTSRSTIWYSARHIVPKKYQLNEWMIKNVLVTCYFVWYCVVCSAWFSHSSLESI